MIFTEGVWLTAEVLVG